ncbi:MAG: sugar transferase [Planctomycetes bacterium]|nr:sugar transferase [Planctomycetota bacterium]MBL7144487.1 sugar transferase [Phycisphaerae bacterium]
MNLFNICKRVLDILIAIAVMVILSPALVAIWIAIKLSSKGPVIFKQERAGKNSKPFVFYKFRTMKPDVEPFGSSPKSGQDPRLTKFGKFLREYSLDELPQLFNVLKGDMSIVGPRPLYISQIPEWNELQKMRLLVKPGLTGLAQISGRAELTREEKLNLDVKYVETASLLTDIRIILSTIAYVFKRKNIYEKSYSQAEYTRGQSK